MSDGTSASSGRIVSLDALRGFDMFCIIGADAFFRSLGGISESGFFGFLARQFEHVRFEGFVFYDLIFPLFVFMVGASLVFSLDKAFAKHGRRAVYARILRRFILLFLMGVIYDEGVAEITSENVICGVLQRIALCYLFTSLLYCHLKPKALAAVLVFILIGYWLFVCFVPIPGVGHVEITREMNWTKYIDDRLPPYYDDDPEGLPSTPPAIATCLLGVFAALALRHKPWNDRQRVMAFIMGGVAMVIMGYLWGLHFPVAKRIWTSSYVLVSGGYSFILLGVFYQIIDVWKYRKWAEPFLWVGMNAITIYMVTAIFDFEALARRFVGGFIETGLGPFGEPLVALVALTLAMALVRFLYKRQIFLRL